MPTDAPDLPLPDPVIDEVVEDLTLDDWVPDFPIVRPQHVRVDSRRWLLLPDRYTFKPLRGLEAARAADQLTKERHGKPLVALASRLMAQRRAIEVMVTRDAAAAIEDATRTGRLFDALTDDELQTEVDARMRDHAQLALEELIGEAGLGLYEEWALPWLARCQAHRVPLPSRQQGDAREPGGLVHAAKGAGEWSTYYAGRELHVLRLAAACCWGSIGPFLVDLS